MPENAPAIDISEGDLRRRGRILDILLSDKTTRRNIIWATDSYIKYGKEYGGTKRIRKEQITGRYSRLIQPRAVKSREEQLRRTKDKAEVFTPLRIVAEMNRMAQASLVLPENHTWRDYVRIKWLEITCGEAPFIVSRYNPVASGKMIKLENRVGFLDSKLGVVGRECTGKNEWIEWAENAVKACYGYEWQGDNLLLARENILLSVDDYYREKFDDRLATAELEKFAEIIAWNVFQMDGLSSTIPLTQISEKRKVIKDGIGMFPAEMLGEKRQEYIEIIRKPGKKVKIMDWDAGKTQYFCKIL